jgi:hypothetical protein
MVMEYGVRRRPRNLFIPVMIVTIVAAVAIVVGWGVWDLIQSRRASIAEARTWTVAGPPCPLLSPDAPPDPTLQALQTSHFHRVTFVRAHGDMECSDVADDGGRGMADYPVCQFSHPGMLKVDTGHGVVAYDLPPLRPATVAVRHGKPSCVVGSSVDFLWRPGMGR